MQNEALQIDDQTILEVLNYDPIDAVEKIEGRPFEIGDLDHFIAANTIKKEVMMRTKDTYNGISVGEVLDLLSENGFEIIFKKEFNYQEYQLWSELGRILVDRTSWYYILWDKKRGILVDFDTWENFEVKDGKLVKILDKINGGMMRYNVTPKSRADMFKGTSSGGFYKPDNLSWNEFEELPCTEKVWVGDHDIREGFLIKLRTLETHYDFKPEWVSSPFMWLMHYCERSSDHEKYGYGLYGGYNSANECNDARIKELPEEVQKAINYGKR